MKLDRAELTGTGVAVAFHAALIAALSLSLAHVALPPEPPSMEVELVDDVGLQSAAPTPVTAPPPQSQTPEQAEIPSPPEPVPTPQVAPTPTPRLEPAPTPKPQPVRQVIPAKPTPAKPTPVAKPRTARIGADFLKGIADTSPSTAPARPAPPRSARQRWPASSKLSGVRSSRAPIVRSIQATAPVASRSSCISYSAGRVV